MHSAAFTIAGATPFRFDLTVWVLRRRAKNMVDRWEGDTYRRVLVLEDIPVLLKLTQTDAAKPDINVELWSTKPILKAQKAEAREIVSAMFGLSLDLQPFYVIAAQDPSLAEIVQQFVGMRPTRFPTIFEALANAVACQQVSLDAGIALLNRLSEWFGLPITDGLTVLHAFPRPEDLLDIPEEALKQIGFSYQKARTIKGIAYSVASGDLDQDTLGRMSNTEAVNMLEALHGIGRWSAEYVLLRGLGRLDIFPGDDVGGQNNIQELLGLSTRPDYKQIKELVAIWRPYAGLVYFHLLLHKLHDKGQL